MVAIPISVGKSMGWAGLNINYIKLSTFTGRAGPRSTDLTRDEKWLYKYGEGREPEFDNEDGEDEDDLCASECSL